MQIDQFEKQPILVVEDDAQMQTALSGDSSATRIPRDGCWRWV